MRNLLILILSLSGFSLTLAQEHEYVPFVREGVKWVCYYENMNCYPYIDQYYQPGKTYFTLEIKGDTVIDGKSYKAMHKYSGIGIDYTNDTIPIFLREEDKIVYGIIPEGNHYPDVMVGYGVNEIYESAWSGKEFILYDFKDPSGYYENLMYAHRNDFEFLYSTDILLGGHNVKRYEFSYYSHPFVIVEGVGYDELSDNMGGYTLQYLESSGPTYHLSHVIEDGEIVYKSKNYGYELPDDEDYVPFVREGVKWVYYYINPFSSGTLEMPSGKQYYCFELTGDVQIGDKNYKPVVLTHYLDMDGREKEEENFTPAYLREEGKVVYALHPDGIQHPRCPVGIDQTIGRTAQGLPIPAADSEFMLYDFNDPKGFYDTFFEEKNELYDSEGLGTYIEYLKTDMVPLGLHQSKCHYFNSQFDRVTMIIEGVGFDGVVGMPLFYFEGMWQEPRVDYYLSHVIEDGEIIYKGIHYDPDNRVAIDEVMTDRGAVVMDGYYYNLMGQPVGKDVPTTPGIYIHNGKKIVVR